ncbi:IS3 family transposase [Streptomyces sp. NPDC002540]
MPAGERTSSARWPTLTEGSAPIPVTPGPSYNAAAESWFAILKAEIGTSMWETREAARADVFRYVEVEYNRSRLRRHPDYGYVTPLETRSLLRQNLTPAA